MSDSTHLQTMLHADDGEAFRLMVAAVRDYAIFMLDADGFVISWNEGAQRIKGYAAHEIIGKHFSTFYPADALAKGWPAEELRRARADGRFEDESWRIRKDGTRFWANVIITALRNPAGDVIGFTKITRDLTERREHEERLRRSEESIRLLVEGVRDHAMFLVSADGQVQTWNAGAERLLGYTSAEAVGRPLSIFYTDEDAAAGKAEAHLRSAHDNGYAEDAGWRVRQNGTRLWADVATTALHNSDGHVSVFATIVRDLSERRRMLQLEVEGQRINEFMAMLAHELRNPLAPIRNVATILKRGTATTQLSWCSEVIGRQVDHMSRLVDDLLDLSRVTSGKIQLHRGPIELGALVRTAVDTMRFTIDKHEHMLELVLPSAPVTVHGDETRLTQVIVNLLANAAKYTPQRGHLRVELRAEDGDAVLSVIDNGIGMPKALIETAFDLFVQGQRTLDRAEGGLGIGLTLVKRIVSLHGGTVAADSAGPGQGSRFTVRLPLITHADEKPEQPLLVPVAERQHILVVDDNEDAAHSLAALLRMTGHEVEVAHDGPSALRAATASPPDTAVLDLGLPGLDGYQLARKMRAVPALAGTRLIAVTGYGQDSDRRAAYSAGFTSHLVKPVVLEELLRALQMPLPDDGTR